LASTNREDVVLAAEAAEAAGLPPTALELLQPHLDTLPPRVYAAHLRALFLLRRADEFDRRWQNAPNTAKADPHTVLCRMAYDAGWGASDSISEARAALARALNDPKLWVTACRAQMVLSSHLLDAEGYAAALHRLELENLERLNERLQYWRLLVQIGRKAEAVRSAGAAFTPRSSQEVLDLLEAYRNLGLTADAIALIRRSLPRFGADPSRAGIGLWMASIEVLIEERLWDDLLAISVEMRNVGDNTAALAGVSRFAEGRALLARGHDQSADTALQDAARLAWPDPNFAAGAAAAMLRLHRPRPALELLGRFEEPLRSSVIYWQAVFDAAYAIKEDSELLLRAATNARDLKPEDPVVSINYAAALLINRKSADEASKITLTFFQKNPGALAAKVNHCFALAMNRRAEEARVLLATVDPTTLNDLELTVFHLCWIEIELQLRHWEACRTHLAKVDRRFLFPSQTRWIDQVRREAAGKS
jgi:tetratricopeptide (TPR) repeat protein